ncbi:hypothetical protein K437DRAFT_258789 [Tilletiaria anomala UBC 951]|uniref:Uncharacterized protein n=1 Tax=Tilletiaria anomala (strain ATCC 24038 / CBS 436.72 / UBC 951) TaxID=1037660 RepID=A0A066VN50_TILAU|nr:uncharacterized protein K437DRAFT_258789 [Tilletiaria anomala UBC 951]KDN40005.1 hypothetical protein K437DRAFT_258789 [Tilletiaria anomala UBC 951]
MFGSEDEIDAGLKNHSVRLHSTVTSGEPQSPRLSSLTRSRVQHEAHGRVGTTTKDAESGTNAKLAPKRVTRELQRLSSSKFGVLMAAKTGLSSSFTTLRSGRQRDIATQPKTSQTALASPSKGNKRGRNAIDAVSGRCIQRTMQRAQALDLASTPPTLAGNQELVKDASAATCNEFVQVVSDAPGSQGVPKAYMFSDDESGEER